LFSLPFSAWALPSASSPESRTETSELTSSDTDLRILIADWGMDSDELLRRLEELQRTVNEQESLLTGLKKHLETEESFRKQEREAGERALATSARLLFLAEKERDFWRASTFVAGGVTVTVGVVLAFVVFIGRK
jgi:siderophore synthetase component